MFAQVLYISGNRLENNIPFAGGRGRPKTVQQPCFLKCKNPCAAIDTVRLIGRILFYNAIML